MGKLVKLVGPDALVHFGVPGMKWGVRNIRNSVKQKYGKAGGGVAGLAGQAAAKAVLGKHWKNKKSVQKTAKTIRDKATGFDDKLGKAFGLRKNKKGEWVVTPEAIVKASVVGTVAGFASFFVEMKVNDFVASKGAESLLRSAEYAQWLANG